MIELQNIQLPLDAMLDGGKKIIRRAVVQVTGVHERDIKSVRVLKRSIDARRKSNVHFVVTLGVEFCADCKREVEREILSNGCSAHGVNVKEHESYEPLEIPHLYAKIPHTGAGGDRLDVSLAQPPRPVVVGTGPAGLFAALYLARAGLRPLVLERGGSVEQRAQAVDDFFNGGELNPYSNIQFGEGGAGTFSDGKLTTNTKNPLTKHVLRWFVEAGAPPEIEVDAKPHIGTDKLRDVVRNMRQQIEDAGGEVRFNTQLTNLSFEDGKLASIVIERTGSDEDVSRAEKSTEEAHTGIAETIPAIHVILACGHSARDTYRMLQKAHVKMERKPFSVGVRIEHKQSDINRAQYGKFASHPALRAADYKLSAHLSNGRGVYTFCMCPGGVVVPATSEAGGVCTNGMSYHARAGENANAALLVSVDPQDFDECEKLQNLQDPLAGIYFQERIERAAYALAQHDAQQQAGESPYNANICSMRENEYSESEIAQQLKTNTCSNHPGETVPYTAPAQTVDSFLNRTNPGPSTKVKPTYARGVVWADLHNCLPAFVAESLEQALPKLDKRLHGFADPQAVLTGVETRTSSPVRIVRDENFQAVLMSDFASEVALGATPANSDNMSETTPTHNANIPSATHDTTLTPTGVYPCGEGAGYAGGIMSAAVDGLKVARALCEQLKLGNRCIK